MSFDILDHCLELMCLNDFGVSNAYNIKGGHTKNYYVVLADFSKFSAVLILLA